MTTNDFVITHPTKYWHKLPNGRIQCDVCPHFCKLQEGQRGFCFVRARANDQIVLTTYGLSSGFCIDPIEKKPLNQFLPGTSVLSFGTVGCNFACRFCQNWDISKAQEMFRLADRASPEAIAKTAAASNCQSVAFTYNEPTVFMEYAVDTAKECHKLGINTVAVTNGYICEEPRKEFYANMDAANVDLKGFTERFYQKIIGGHLQTVLDTLRYIKKETNVWLEITTLLIPDENDSTPELEQLTKWIMDNLGPDVPLHFSAFHPAWKMLDKAPTPFATLQRAREIGIKNGLHHVYTGNVLDLEGASTYCSNCKKRIIAREGFTVVEYNLDKDSNCKFCHTKCAGIFSKELGSWDGARQPIKIGK